MDKKQRIGKISESSDREERRMKKTVRRSGHSSDASRNVRKTKVKGKRVRSSGHKRTDINRGQRSSSIESVRTTSKKHIEEKNSQVRRKRRRRRRERHIFARLIQLALILALIGILIFVISNFGEANKLNSKGLEAYESADYEMANSYFTKAIEKDGTNYEYYLNKGMALSELKMYKDALTAFDEALEHADNNSETQMVWRARGISLLYQGSYDEALEAFETALNGKESRYSDTDIDILYYKAETLDKAGRFVDAVLVYSKIVDSNASADAYMLRGMEYVKVGDYPSAESDLRTAIKKDKKNYDIYLALYHALTSQKKHDDAAAVLEEALKLGGNKGEALVNQGKIYMKLGEISKAEEKLLKALDKGEISANLALAQIQMEKTPADYTAAVNYFETYLTSVTNDAEAYNMYGLCLVEMEEYEKAEEAFTKGVALNDRLMDRSISKNQISAAEHAGHWANALEYIEVYLQKYSDDETAIKEKEFIQTRIR